MNSQQNTNCVAVAVSGGADSTALFYATAIVAKASGLQVVGLHIHHGLQEVACGWVTHLQEQCAYWAELGLPVRLRVAYLTDKPPAEKSVEAWAHDKRHKALAKMAKEENASILLLAHHSKDQAETVLLQAFRGADAHGLAAMPKVAIRDGLVWARPFLNTPPEALKAYIEENDLTHIEDPSNKDNSYDRNKLRNVVWPALKECFPSIDTAMGLVAKQAWNNAQLIDEIANDDLAEIIDEEKALLVGSWLHLSNARRYICLKLWLRRYSLSTVSDRFVTQLCENLTRSVVAKWRIDELHEARLYKGKLTIHKVYQQDRFKPCLTQTAWYPNPTEEWSELPGDMGYVRLKRVSEKGIGLDELNVSVWKVRKSGERFSLAENAKPHTLKKQYQYLGIPEWKRQGPLLWSNDKLLWVPGLGVNSIAYETGSTPQYTIEWVSDPKLL